MEALTQIKDKTIEIMAKINGWFYKQKHEFDIPEEKVEVIHDAPAPTIEEAISENFGDRIEECTWCKQPIETYQKRKTFGGKKYHKKCHKFMYREARKQLGV